MMTQLPTDIARVIYRMYFSWVLAELLEKHPEKNDFIVRTTRSNTALTEVNAQFGILSL